MAQRAGLVGEQRPDRAPGAGPAAELAEPSVVGARRPVDATSAVGAVNSGDVFAWVAGAWTDRTPSPGRRTNRRQRRPDRRSGAGAGQRAAPTPSGRRAPAWRRFLDAVRVSVRVWARLLRPRSSRARGSKLGRFAAALRAEARTRFDGADPDATWIRAHTKAVRRAMTRAVDAESRVAARAGRQPRTGTSRRRRFESSAPVRSRVRTPAGTGTGTARASGTERRRRPPRTGTPWLSRTTSPRGRGGSALN